MRKLLVFQHVPYEPLGTLDEQFRDAGFRIRYVNFARGSGGAIDVQRYHGLVVLGGPMGVNDADRYPHLRDEMAAIRLAIEAGLPVLGICLGAQLIAGALGAAIRKNDVREIGWTPIRPTEAGRHDPLFRHFRREEQIFQWHGDTFALPDGAELLAENDACAHQAFRYGAGVYGLQFHLEVDEALIRRWLATPGMRRELAELRAAGLPEAVLEQTRRYIARSSRLSRAVFGAFIDRHFGWRRRLALPSR
jgi:GMP synthase (glutamine-hydrolysing)